MPASNETHARVRKVLVQALGVEEDDVKPSATLQGDLGAESIDFLDITFRLEREFGIKIPRGELFPDDASRDRLAFTGGDLPPDESRAASHSQMPCAESSILEHDRRSNRGDDLFTVDLLTNYIEWKLSRGGPWPAAASPPSESTST
jgi:acyl carrier protein